MSVCGSEVGYKSTCNCCNLQFLPIHSLPTLTTTSDSESVHEPSLLPLSQLLLYSPHPPRRWDTRDLLNESKAEEGKFLLKDCKTREEKNESHEGWEMEIKEYNGRG